MLLKPEIISTFKGHSKTAAARQQRFLHFTEGQFLPTASRAPHRHAGDEPVNITWREEATSSLVCRFLESPDQLYLTMALGWRET